MAKCQHCGETDCSSATCWEKDESAPMEEGTDLEGAMYRVADAGRDASNAAYKTRGEWIVPCAEMVELRSAVAEWSKASHRFLQALRVPGKEA